MEKNTIYIITGVAIIAIGGYIIWRKKKDKEDEGRPPPELRKMIDPSIKIDPKVIKIDPIKMTKHGLDPEIMKKTIDTRLAPRPAHVRKAPSFIDVI